MWPNLASFLAEQKLAYYISCEAFISQLDPSVLFSRLNQHFHEIFFLHVLFCEHTFLIMVGAFAPWRDYETARSQSPGSSPSRSLISSLLQSGPSCCFVRTYSFSKIGIQPFRCQCPHALVTFPSSPSTRTHCCPEV